MRIRASAPRPKRPSLPSNAAALFHMFLVLARAARWCWGHQWVARNMPLRWHEQGAQSWRSPPAATYRAPRTKGNILLHHGRRLTLCERVRTLLSKHEVAVASGCCLESIVDKERYSPGPWPCMGKSLPVCTSTAVQLLSRVWAVRSCVSDIFSCSREKRFRSSDMRCTPMRQASALRVRQASRTAGI